MPDAVTKTLWTVTPGERLRLWRETQRASQRDLVRLFHELTGHHITRAQLQYMEGGRSEEGARRTLVRLRDGFLPPTRPQQCLLARWRSRTPTTDLAASLGVCRVTLGRMEDRADPRLVALWRKRGFRFSQ